MKFCVSLPTIALFCAYLSTPAVAAPTYYFNDPVADRAAFEAAAAPGLSLESFEDAFASASSVDFPIGGPTEVTISTNETLSQSSFARGVSDGSNSLAVNENPQTTLTLQFVSPIQAFGIDANDLNFVDMTFSDNLGNVFTDVLLGDDGSDDGGPGFENRQFFGVTNAVAFSTVVFTFSPTTSSGTLFFDRLQYGAIPEPSAVVLFASGLVMWRTSTRRKSATRHP